MPSKVALLVFPGISAFHLSAPSVIFGELSPDFELKLCAEGALPVQLPSMSGFHFVVNHGLEAIAEADLVIIPSWYNPYQPPSEKLQQAIQQAHAKGAQIIGLCLGAYLLAACGLLDHKTATTHWAFAEDLQQRFPKISLDANVLYLEQGTVMTSAGTSAAIDCCLHIIRQRISSKEANRIARLMVMPPHRSGGQAQYIDIPLPETSGDQRLSKLIDWMLENLQHNFSIDNLAKRAAMSRRSFTRHFKALTGKSVALWVVEQRLRAAQQLLEETDLSIEAISQKIGFGSAVTLRHHFKQQFAVSPSQWRKTFKLK